MSSAEKTRSFTPGQSLIEIVIALGVFLIVATGSAILAFRYIETLSRARAVQKAEFILRSSFEAVQSIGYEDWAAVANGTYGLSSAAGSYDLQANPDVIENTYTRTVTISPVSRDGTCTSVVSEGGVNDNDTKSIQVRLDWNSGGPQSKTYSQYITRYFTVPGAPSGCTVAETEASHFEIDISTAYASYQMMYSPTFRNNSTVPVTLDKLTITWAAAPARIKQIMAMSGDWWGSGWQGNSGSPVGPQVSGTELDIVDQVFLLDDQVWPEEDQQPYIFFEDENNITGSTFTFTATMGDGSTVTTGPFTAFGM